VEEGARRLAVAGAAVAQHDDIAAGAESAPFGMVEQHAADLRVVPPA
jgi:hypothetical protein